MLIKRGSISDTTVESQIKALSEKERELTDNILALISGDSIKIDRVEKILNIVEIKAHQFVQDVDLNGFYKGGINKQ